MNLEPVSQHRNEKSPSLTVCPLSCLTYHKAWATYGNQPVVASQRAQSALITHDTCVIASWKWL